MLLKLAFEEVDKLLRGLKIVGHMYLLLVGVAHSLAAAKQTAHFLV